MDSPGGSLAREQGAEEQRGFLDRLVGTVEINDDFAVYDSIRCAFMLRERVLISNRSR
jgi:hypothetical protein